MKDKIIYQMIHKHVDNDIYTVAVVIAHSINHATVMFVAHLEEYVSLTDDYDSIKVVKLGVVTEDVYDLRNCHVLVMGEYCPTEEGDDYAQN